MATVEVNTALAAQFTELGTGKDSEDPEDEAAATANAIVVDHALGCLATSVAASTAAATDVEDAVSDAAASWSMVQPVPELPISSQGQPPQPPLGTFTAVSAADTPVGSTVTGEQVAAAQWTKKKVLKK